MTIRNGQDFREATQKALKKLEGQLQEYESEYILINIDTCEILMHTVDHNVLVDRALGLTEEADKKNRLRPRLYGVRPGINFVNL